MNHHPMDIHTPPTLPLPIFPLPSFSSLPPLHLPSLYNTHASLPTPFLTPSPPHPYPIAFQHTPSPTSPPSSLHPYPIAFLPTYLPTPSVPNLPTFLRPSPLNPYPIASLPTYLLTHSVPNLSTSSLQPYIRNISVHVRPFPFLPGVSFPDEARVAPLGLGAAVFQCLT